jgi:hypothetical protein
MNDFVKVMGTIGQFFPPPSPYPNTSQDSAWEGVANSFRKAGDDLRFAIDKRSNEVGGLPWMVS